MSPVINRFSCPSFVRWASASLVLLVCATAIPAGQSAGAASTQGATAAENWQDGFLPVCWDAGQGRVLLRLTSLDSDVLFYSGVSRGIGSVELGVDRGAAFRSDVIHFHRDGKRVVVLEDNLRYRATSGSEELRRSVADSFAGSVIASLPIQAEREGALVVDASPLVLSDIVDLAGSMRTAKQGAYRLDATRSFIDGGHTKAFPRNTETEATLTYTSDTGGPLLERVAPDARTVTVRVHYSFIQTPPPGYRPRLADARIGNLDLFFKDYSKPFSTATDTHWVHRFRLEKKNPGAAVSEPKQPLVYYLDAGIPEPVRSAMRSGLLWWNQAFEAAGFRNAIVVKDPTPDMDPMDIRYNFVFWESRDERGFSVGGSFDDPRTGEIIAARVRLDSARIRTMSAYWHAYQPSFAPRQRSEQDFVLARQALLTAHEVGHTLGFPHAWDSSMNDRASVMEYPSPRLRIADNRIDISDAFQPRIGEFDKYMARYAYAEAGAGRETAMLEALVAEMRRKDLVFTPPTDPRWNRYDEGSDAAQYLKDTVAQRRILLEHYGLDALQPGQDISDLRGLGLWIVYLHHRWAIDAGVKYVGGMYHNYVHKGDSLTATEIVPAAYQKQILALLLGCLQPQNLAMPEALLRELTVDPNASGADSADLRSTVEPEEFKVSTGYAFDQLSAARTLADMVIGQLLMPERVNRLVSFEGRQQGALTLPSVVTQVIAAGWDVERPSTAQERALQRVVRQVAVEDLMTLAANAKTGPEARAVVLQHLWDLKSKIAGLHDEDPVTEATLRQTERDLTRFLNAPGTAPAKTSFPQPAGAPI